MRFSSGFLVSNFFIFGLPLAVQRERDSNAIHGSDEGLLVRDNADASKDFTTTLSTSLNSDGRNLFDQPLVNKDQPLSTHNQLPSSKYSTALPGLVPSTKSSLIAQSLGEDIQRAAAGANAALWGGVGAGFGALWEGVQNLGNPSTTPKNDDGTNQGETTQGTTMKNKGGTVQGTTITRQGGTGAAAEDGEATLEAPCADPRFGLRTVAWCDMGYPSSVVIVNGYEVRVFGYRFLGVCIRAYQEGWCCDHEDDQLLNAANDCLPWDELHPELGLIFGIQLPPNWEQQR